MSLFQISEPGESQAKAQCLKPAVGIDLGTTNTLVACVREGNPVVLAGEGEAELIPSVVHYGESGVSVGAEAMQGQCSDPVNTISSAKRFVGRALSDVDDVARHLPYNMSDDGGRMVRFNVAGGRQVTPIEVQAEILKAAKERASRVLGEDIEDAVITVPAYFDDAQRQATKDAGRLAGLEVMRLVAEPTAAALAYGLDQGTQGLFAVYDLGGGTFDVSILRLVDGVFEVVATGGNSALGGDDFDRLIAEDIYSGLGLEPDSLSAEDGARVLAEARRLKHAVSESEDAESRLELGTAHSGYRFSRARLRELAEPLLARTRKACRRALKDAELSKEELDGVILVGGATRSPVVRSYVEDFFGREALATLDPELVVAMGAAAQAHLLAGGDSDMLLLDVVPLSLGIETMGGVVEKLIHRNSTIPVRARQEFTTYADNQTGFDIHVVQGERESVDDNRSLARFLLRGIPPMVAGAARLEVIYAVDADGLLRVSARETTTGLEASVDVKPSYGLSDDEVEKMLLDSFEYAEEDLKDRNLRVQRVEAERILMATKAALEADPALLEDGDEDAIAAAMDTLNSASDAGDHQAIRKAIEALDLASKPFAERRMNRAVRSAVSGRSISDVDSSLGDGA